jgi:hypothetical protein
MWTLPCEGNEGLVLYVIGRMRAWDRREIFATRDGDSDLDLLEAVMASGDVSWIAGRDEEPIAVYGCRPMWPGVWSMWLFATDNLGRIGKSVTQHVRTVIVPGLFREGARRLECRSMEGHTDAQRWLLHLGAVREGTNRAFGRDGEDFHVYVWGRP